MSRAFNKWRQVSLKGLLTQLIEEEETKKTGAESAAAATKDDAKTPETPGTTARRGQRNNAEVTFHLASIAILRFSHRLTYLL